MIGLGVILLVCAVILLLAPLPFPNKDSVGWLGVFAGLVLIVVGAVLSHGVT